MNRKSFEVISYIAIGIVFIFLMLMIFKLIPTGWFVYILGFSILLLILRMIFRVYFIMQDKKKN